MQELLIICWTIITMSLTMIIWINYDTKGERDFQIECIKNWGDVVNTEFIWRQKNEIICKRK